ncbi:hypothetical protein D9615_000745 [Tricholomella constricta]|uniref:Spindle pole body component n=1 Tax=Tricholomella constricta TaxID=117010 RepID=A0A8H5MC98_9AGAR|nr:hypothetical protein D9615_000745 [Tricholomella constricta]
MLPPTSSSYGLSVPRPHSALSTLRPHSSLSVHRPPSSASSRPLSRLSARSQARHARSRLIPLAQALVRQVTGLDDGKDADAAMTSDFREAVEFVVKNLEATTLNKGAASVDMEIMDRQIRGHALKARLNSQDEVSEALEARYQHLKANLDRARDIDEEITSSRLPDHLQLLIKLSKPPTPLTQHHASSILHASTHPPSPPPTLTWASIVAEEPFEGDHWEGVYGLPPGFVRRDDRQPEGYYDREKESERLDWDSRWSTPSLSPLNSDDLELDEDQEDEERERERALAELNESESQSREDEGVMADDALVYGERAPGRVPPHTYAHRKEFEALQAKQYWREDWRGDVDPSQRRPFDMGDASTLGPTLRRMLRTGIDVNAPLAGSLESVVQNERYINEEDATRELLMALQGRTNIMLEWDTTHNDHLEGMTKSTPCLLHLSLDAQASILASFAHSASTLQHLRNFVSGVFADAESQYTHRPTGRAGKSKSRSTRTREAFADAVDHEIRALDKWCAAREEAMCLAWGGGGGLSSSSSSSSSSSKSAMLQTSDDLTISLLGTEKAAHDAFERTFDVLLDIVHSVYPDSASPTSAPSSSNWTSRNRSASAVSAALLDQLFASVQAHLERGEQTAGAALLRVFVRSAEPIWGMMGKWLRDGMGLGVAIGSGDAAAIWELDDEFFIESSGLGVGMMGLGLLDPEFWREGYALREGVVYAEKQGEAAMDVDVLGGEERRQKTIPLFLEHVAEPVLSAGKAVGLLRALGVPLSSITAANGAGEWRSFEDLVNSTSPSSEDHQEDEDTLFSVSIDTLSRVIYDRLLPRCNAAGALLARVLVDDCALWSHLQSIEDMFLMRRGDAMSHFTDVLFAKMDAQQSWTDFHFLNTAFRDVVEASSSVGAKEWIQTSLVRLVYRGGKEKDRAIARTVKALDGLAVEYAVPFPLTYVFQPATLQGYGEVFVLLLQIRRAKGVLERILVRGEARGERLRAELKAFYAMRSRLSWFINTLLNFLTTYVVHAQVVKFQKEFREAKSLDEMVRLHDDHLDKIRSRCLLKPNTSSLYRAILSILDMALHFTDFFVTFAGDTTTTLDVSRQSISMRRHRSRRHRHRRRNVIGFSQSLRDMEDSSDESEDEIQEVGGADAPEPSFSTNASVSYAEEGFQTRMDKMSSELDGLVRFLRRGVESLAGGTGEAAPAYGVLAFALEDWDN